MMGKADPAAAPAPHDCAIAEGIRDLQHPRRGLVADIDVAAAGESVRATRARRAQQYAIVGDETATRVLEVADSLGYRANRVAQALRRRVSFPFIGLPPATFQNPFFARIAHDSRSSFAARGHNLLIASSEVKRSSRTKRELLESLRSLSVRGFVLAPTSASDNQHIVSLARDGAPIVLIDRVAENVRCDSVVVDNAGGAREGGRLSGGQRASPHRAAARRNRGSSRRRNVFAGYRGSLQSHGIALDDSLVGISRSTVEQAIEATIRLFSRRDRPTALFTVDRLDDPGRAPALRSMGLAIPRDVSVVGVRRFSIFATFTDPHDSPSWPSRSPRSARWRQSC